MGRRQKPVDAAENGGTIELSIAVPVTDGPQEADPIMTCELLPGSDSSQLGFAESGQIGSADFEALPTLVDSKRGILSSPAVLENVTVPGYDILEELGRGGMGVVYKARHRRLQRLVALKMVLAGAHVGQVGLARFRAEAEAVAKLLHSNIVQIYETGEHEGRPYFSLEFVEGGSLDQRIGESPTSPRAAAQLRRDAGAHHGRWPTSAASSIATSNRRIFSWPSWAASRPMVRNREVDSSSLPADHWSRTTVPKIADFGLAKQVDDDSSQTQSGTILGTPSYMAPEQAGGKNREIGPAADIYSLGAILYELLVGRPPFKAGNPIDTIRQVIEQEPVPPRQLGAARSA